MARCRSVYGVRVGTQLYRDRKAGQHIACKQQLGIKERVELAANGLLAALVIGCGKQGAVGFGAGNKTEKLTVGDDGRNAVQRASARSIGQTDDNEHIVSGAGLDDLLKRSFCAAENYTVTYKVIAGAAGQRKLGENENLYALVGRFFHALDDLAGVIFCVGDFDHRRCGSNFNKSVFHFDHSFL